MADLAEMLGREWLEPDGLGGFASGTAAGVRTRRYHGLLLSALTPPTGRAMLVSGLEVWVEGPGGRTALSSQRYAPDVTHPDGWTRIESFANEPWPTWTYRLPDGGTLEHELFVRHGSPTVVLSWRLRGARSGTVLSARPLLCGRDYHALHHENGAFRFDALETKGEVRWRPYEGSPPIVAQHNGAYRHAPEWYRRFQYDAERERGLDFLEDLASPGVFTFDLAAGEATLILARNGESGADIPQGVPADARAQSLRVAERARRRFATPLHRAADAYIARRRGGKTIVAGYPWFTDWGRDTFIALRGLCLAGGRYDDARQILVEWAGAVSEGMLPNLFPDAGTAPEYNSVDASLWYCVAVHEFLDAARAGRTQVSRSVEDALTAAVEKILQGYYHGTRYGIRADVDGLLACGVPGVQLTWMDAKVGDWVVTPRIGKPVEVQALWLNALALQARTNLAWKEVFERGLASFRERFARPDGSLYDVADADHRPGAMDASFRPNQIFAVGGLPVALLEGAEARAVVDAVEARLWTPLGLRSLAPGEPGYRPRYEGGPLERDGAYHQGTVWPWLAGPFVEAWVRVRGGTKEARDEARERFLAPLLAHLGEAGLGHASEIADAEPPHAPRGCPFQAWSVGELLRLQEAVLADAP